jgi:CRP-like cAMP-binding protein
MQRTSIDSEVTTCTRCPVGIASGIEEGGRCPFVPRRRGAGAVLHVAGDPVERVCFIKSGEVLVTRSSDEERVEGTPWAVRRPGSFLGLEGLVQLEHLDSARALGDVTLCGASLEEIRAWLDARRTAAQVLLDAVLRSSVRERPFRGNVDGSAVRRAAAWLMERASRRSEHPSRRVLAGLLGMRPETLSRALRALADAGVIHTDRRSIAIRDPARLRSIARYGRRSEAHLERR